MKRIALVLLAACVIVLAATGVAYANFGPHGGFLNDTDSCAGCHRGHTSTSALTWTDQLGGQRSALLISDAANMTDFCYACHGDAAPGASTNVQMGVFDSGPAGSSSTNSSFNATLNAGGFEALGASTPVMSAHDMNRKTNIQGDLVRWGMTNPGTGSSNNSVMSAFTCTTCHDPHGSSNYRLLKDSVNGVKVGGYDESNTPEPIVLSNEAGYPTGGFRKGSDGQVDIANYKPNYTAEQIRYAVGQNMSAWCAACHTSYDNEKGNDISAAAGTTYGAYESWVQSTTPNTAAGPLGVLPRHRHRVNVPIMDNMNLDPADNALTVPLLDDPGLPLDMESSVAGGSKVGTATYWTKAGFISCLTCHRAHGSEATMNGWAVSKLTTTPVGVGSMIVTPGVTTTAGTFANPLGVAPNYSQAILRFNNRGVCERCHNK